jgi:hypothetical protein
VDLDEVLLDEVELGDIVVVTVVGLADTTDRTKDRPTLRRLSNSLWLVVAAVGALVVCAQDRVKKRVLATASSSPCDFIMFESNYSVAIRVAETAWMMCGSRLKNEMGTATDTYYLWESARKERNGK